MKRLFQRTAALLCAESLLSWLSTGSVGSCFLQALRGRAAISSANSMHTRRHANFAFLKFMKITFLFDAWFQILSNTM